MTLNLDKEGVMCVALVHSPTSNPQPVTASIFRMGNYVRTLGPTRFLSLLPISLGLTAKKISSLPEEFFFHRAR